MDLERTRILSPVDGYVTNLLAQLRDYVNVGATISLVDSDSYWVDGYFEETNLALILVGDPAQINLMDYSQNRARPWRVFHDSLEGASGDRALCVVGGRQDNAKHGTVR